MAREGSIWRRGAVTLGVVGIAAVSLAVAPVGAQSEDRLSGKEKRKVTRIVDKRLGAALATEQDSCQHGAVLAFAVIDTADVSILPEYSTSGIISQFNCRGGTIEATWNGSGYVRVRIPGITTPSIIDADDFALLGTAASTEDIDDDLSVTYKANAGEDFVHVYHVDGGFGGIVEGTLTIAALNDPS